ncbi:MFS transporter [Rhodococcus opacus]|uniref:MFS transporter n=1 Tax=Rhodococcus opacus TaxID=37919 RepID=UPI0021581200|nr:MFS transporter [Rhodococcus opacus]UUK33951.1 MFS transporter [Rhodococcus opacus]
MLFLIEGIPPILLAGAVWFCLVDRPADAKWLTDEEKATVEGDLAADEARKAGDGKGSTGHTGLRAALRDPRVLILGLCACGAYTLANAVSFWTPRIINNAGVDNVLSLGLFSAITPLAGIIVMQIVGRHSDRTLERRWHAAGSWFVASAGLVALSFVTNSPQMVVVLLAVVAAAHYAGLTVFYSIPSIYLSGRGTATGIALVTTMGSFAAALSPALLGFIQEHPQPLVGTAHQRRPRGDRWHSARRRYPGARLEGEELMRPGPSTAASGWCSDVKPGEVGSGGPPPAARPRGGGQG